ncbi:MAG: YqhA family protein, partial [Silvanigrellaceae bacterium]|nr:YqhA family protein [Silvanigrellaceae bacterium]
LGILQLVDFTMVANLLVMVIIGGYATFVSKLNLENHDDKPDWLDHIDPGAIKIKLASSLIGISSIHLLRSFIDFSTNDIEKVKWQIIIHVTFIASTVFLAVSEYIMSKKHARHDD